MMRFTWLVLVAALAGSASARGEQEADRQAVLKARLERFKRLTPEQKQKLRERVELLKKLPAEERGRLQENFKKFQRLTVKEQQVVREKIQKLAPEEKKTFVEVSAGFFQWANKQGFLEGFPRELFFQWMKEQRAEDLGKLKTLESADRKDAFVRLYFDFKEQSLKRFREHVARHKCNSGEQLQGLADADVREFWPHLRQSWERCGVNMRKSNGGPIPPRK